MTARRGSRPGAVTDVAGVLVGHVHRRGRGWRTGTTVIHVPGGAVAAVDVRGGGPGTRETDALEPGTLVDVVHAVCLTGGSAYGLAAADGVMAWLERAALGVRVGPAPNDVVPVVPTAVIFDLGRGGRFSSRPDASFGERAIASASSGPVARGAVGAGTGAVAGGLQGGVGTASSTVDGVVVGAIAVVNAAGTLLDSGSGLPWVVGDDRLRRPTPGERRALDAARRLPPGSAPAPVLNTTIGVIATSAELTVAEARKLASVGHDGMARAVRPVHSMFDGDTVFALATGDVQVATVDGTEVGFRDPHSRPAALNRLLEAGADCFARACVDAIVSARSHRGGPPAYRDLAPGAFRDADDPGVGTTRRS